jgi:hypothetical protein
MMKRLRILLFCLLPLALSAQQDSLRLRRGKAIAIGGTTLSVVGGLWWYLENTWWAEDARGFRVDFNRDLRYANNLDKMGHYVGGIMTADLYYDAFRWMGMDERKAAWWGFGFGTGLQMAIEIKDGFSPDWGFSVSDIVLGTAGSLQPLLRQTSPFFRNTDVKFSYWQRSDKYFIARDLNNPVFHIDDYINQTYWVSTNLRYITGNRIEWIPDWLNLSVGWGIDAATWNTDPSDPGTGGKPEIYLAPDIDLVRLFKPRKPFWKFTLHRLNYLKFPMPAIQFTPKVRAWGIYY